MVTARVLISNSYSHFTNPLVTVPRAPIRIGIAVTFIFHCNFFSSLASFKYLSFRFSFKFTLWSTGTAKSKILLVHFFFVVFLVVFCCYFLLFLLLFFVIFCCYFFVCFFWGFFFVVVVVVGFFFSLLLFLLNIIRSCISAEISLSICISKFQITFCISLSRTDSRLCIFHLFI